MGPIRISGVGPLRSSTDTAVPINGSKMSTTRRNDLALIGIVLLACGIGMLATSAVLAERLLTAGGLWAAAVAAFATARR
jgi:hypothetical protein